ncbi:hypothetical protein [Kribbella sp.]|uniref:hypothetical protein n=1 Tax=Kribbella sp. TaxID=1871183 RepID=UPI002D3710FC|nr:hypothetical protein [Kribbella sp.]HZX06793.1 hypothetical protein [Kribbella sp.]
MQTPYQPPNGDTAMVTDTGTAAQSLARAVQLWHEGKAHRRRRTGFRCRAIC